MYIFCMCFLYRVRVCVLFFLAMPMWTYCCMRMKILIRIDAWLVASIDLKWAYLFYLLCNIRPKIMATSSVFNKSLLIFCAIGLLVSDRGAYGTYERIRLHRTGGFGISVIFYRIINWLRFFVAGIYCILGRFIDHRFHAECMRHSRRMELWNCEGESDCFEAGLNFLW